ncbi:MAG: hypothetical protein AAF899_18510 [Pseudomonadota bacterium]
MSRIAKIALALAAVAGVSACQTAPDGSVHITPYQLQPDGRGGWSAYPTQQAPAPYQTAPVYGAPAPVYGEPAPAPVPASGPAQLLSGQYVGLWKDGRELVEEVIAYDDATLLTRRVGDTGAPAVFRHVEDGFYRHDSGAVILVTGPDSFSWANGRGENIVDYLRY